MPKKNNPGCGCCGCPETDCLDTTSSLITQLTFNIGIVPNPFVRWSYFGTSIYKLSIPDWPGSVAKIFTLQGDCSWSTVASVDLNYTVTEYLKNSSDCAADQWSVETGTTTVNFNLGVAPTETVPWSLEVISGSIPSVGTVSVQYTVAYNGNFPCGTTDLRADNGTSELVADPVTGICSQVVSPLYAEVVAA